MSVYYALSMEHTISFIPITEETFTPRARRWTRCILGIMPRILHDNPLKHLLFPHFTDEEMEP